MIGDGTYENLLSRLIVPILVPGMYILYFFDTRRSAMSSLKAAKRYFKEDIIIDSSIWMSKKHKGLFLLLEHVCIANNYKIIMKKKQFDDICSIDKKNYKENLGIERINYFQERKLIIIDQNDLNGNINNNENNVIVNILYDNYNNGVKSTFISDNTENIVKAKSIISDSSEPIIEIINTEKYENTEKPDNSPFVYSETRHYYYAWKYFFLFFFNPIEKEK